jgi:predicted alpha/beta hydrolase family esterase
MKRAYIVHGWASSPQDCWFPWLSGELEKRGYSVVVPAMPEPKDPEPEAWLRTLEQEIGSIDGAVLVGHSLGVRALSLYVQSRPQTEKATLFVSVAGPFTFPTHDHPHPRAQATRDRWKDKELDTKTLRVRVERFVGVYCPEDPWVPYDNAQWMKENLDATIIEEHNKGHFRAYEDNILELPSVVTVIEKGKGEGTTWCAL